ncbi:MAG TPA: zinc-dependent alcohol dehydrogenase [Kineosporiaceae bacterium]|nr:zinc-dependent alcohol dehydrogenase [Kineosporiaceae bacterium]
MKAVTWQGKRDVQVKDVPDPKIEEPTDVVIRVTSTAICGSDLHLYEVLAAYMHQDDILGHEPMGIVEEVGSAVEHVKPGDRVVIPFNISCGHCFMCDRGLFSQCETTQVRSEGKGAALLGYTQLYGRVPGGQAEYLRVPQGHFGPIKVSPDGPDEKYLFMSDVVPTAWQAVEYANPEPGGDVVVYGLGPIGQMAARIALHRGASRVVGLDPVKERRDMAARHGVEALDPTEMDDVPGSIIDLFDGRGPESVIEAVGMEAHGSPRAKLAQTAVGLLPDAVAQPFIDKAAIDRMAALHAALKSARRGGTVSISGVYGGEQDPFPMMEVFDRQLQLRMGQANVKKWIPEILPLLDDPSDPLGVLDLTTHTVPLDEAPGMYETFQKKEDGCIKVVLKP